MRSECSRPVIGCVGDQLSGAVLFVVGYIYNSLVEIYRTVAGCWRRDRRANSTALVLVLIVGVAVLVVGIAVFGGALSGGDAGTDDDLDDSAPDESPAGDDPPESEDDTQSDDDEQRNGDESGSDDDSDSDGDTGGDETEDGSDAVAMPVEIHTTDLGALPDGELRLYNETGTQVATHNVTEHGHEHTFEGLDNQGTYDLEVNTSVFPDETIRFNPILNDELNETIGYEFQGADSYVLDWEVDDLPVNVDIDDEDAEDSVLPLRGTSKQSQNGDYHVQWVNPTVGTNWEYFHFDELNQSYRYFEGDWEEVGAYWGDPSTSRDVLVCEGLSGVGDREFVKEREVIAVDRDVVHVYRIGESLTGTPNMVEVDPNTGYTIRNEIVIGELEDPGVTRSVSEAHSHDKQIDAVPDHFPVEEFEREQDS